MFIVITLAFTTVELIPAALWAGALTPIIVSREGTHAMLIAHWADTNESTIPNVVDLVRSHGRSSWPPINLAGLMLNSAGGASEINNDHRHPKLDRTGFWYRSRSYGMGASVGLVPLDMPEPVTAYRFHETGFEASVSCIYNLTSAFVLKADPVTLNDLQPGMNNASGPLPNDYDLHLPTLVELEERHNYTIMTRGRSAVAFAGQYGPEGVGYVAITTTAEKDDLYGSLNATQCQLAFTPRRFSVTVDNEHRTISVHPLRDEVVPWPSYGNAVLRTLMEGFEKLGELTGSGFHAFSTVGDTFTTNMAAARHARGNSVDANLTSIADAVSSLADNILVSLASLQVVNRNETEKVPMTTTRHPAAVGEPWYIYATGAFNLLVCGVYVVAAGCTRWWRLVGQLNFLDAGNMAVAASAGGGSIYGAVARQHTAQGSRWVADVDDRLVGETRVSLIHQDEGVALVAMDPKGNTVERVSAPEQERPSIEMRPLLNPSQARLGSRQVNDRADVRRW